MKQSSYLVRVICILLYCSSNLIPFLLPLTLCDELPHLCIQKMLEARASLPISRFKDHFLQLLKENDVIVVCGETGCGKTTQVPPPPPPQQRLHSWALPVVIPALKDNHIMCKTSSFFMPYPFIWLPEIIIFTLLVMVRHEK